MFKIIKYPEIILRKTAKIVTSFDRELKETSKEMHNIMQKLGGIGLAGPQINFNKRIVIIGDLNNKDYSVYINPEITYFSNNKEISEEGCLSLPNIFGLVKRSKKIHLKYRDLGGNKIKEKLKGLKSVVIQHEIDHLNGILFIDRVEEITKGKEKLKELKYKLENNG